MKQVLLFLVIGCIAFNTASAQQLADFLPEPSASQREWHKQLESRTYHSNRKVIYRRIHINEMVNKQLFYPSSYKDRSITFTELVVGSVLLNRLPAFTYQTAITDLSLLKRIDPDSLLLTHNLHRDPSKYTSIATANMDDIKWSEIGAYLIKEIHYLSANDSQLQFEIEAICPLRIESTGSERMYYPIAWLKYKDLEPYLILLNTSIYNKNDNDIYSLNDYFRRHLYKGDIIRKGERFDRNPFSVSEDKHGGCVYNDSILKKEIVDMERRYFIPKDSLPPATKKTVFSSPHRSVKR